jgi:hypothetical protein
VRHSAGNIEKTTQKTKTKTQVLCGTPETIEKTKPKNHHQKKNRSSVAPLKENGQEKNW